MSTKRVEFVNLELVFPSLVLGGFLIACLWGGCSHLESAHKTRREVGDLKYRLDALNDNVTLLNRERNARQTPPNVISCEEYQRLTSAVPSGSTIILGNGTIVEGPCK